MQQQRALVSRRAKEQARQGERSELCDGGVKELLLERGGGREKEGGGQGEGVGYRRRAAHLDNKKQDIIEKKNNTTNIQYQVVQFKGS